MLTYVVIGATYGFAAAVQPGQFQAFLVAQVMTSGWRRTVPAALAPLISDAPVIAFVLFLLTALPSWFLGVLQVIGGGFLLFLALGALRSARHFQQAAAMPAPAHRTLLKAALVNFVNPNPYIAWTLVMGPLLLRAWREAPANGVALVVAFYLTMVAATAVLVLLLAGTRALGPRVARWLVGASAVTLAAFGIYQLWAGSAVLLQHP